MVQLLVPEEQDPVAQQGGADGGDGSGVEGLGDVEAVDLGADPAGDRPDVERGLFEQIGHGTGLLLVGRRHC